MNGLTFQAGKVDGAEAAIITFHNTKAPLALDQTTSCPIASSHCLERVVNDLNLLATLTHANLCKFLGYTLSQAASGVDLRACYSTKDCGNTLTSYISELVDGPPAMRVCLNMANGIASALSYLHANEIVHAMLSPLSVYVASDLSVFVCHAGVSGLYAWTDDNNSLPIVRYMAPECLVSKFAATSASDVFSFAVVITELLTQQQPFETAIHCNDIYNAVVLNQSRPKLPLSCPVGLQNLITSCWANKPSERPDCDRISFLLHMLLVDDHSSSDDTSSDDDSNTNDSDGSDTDAPKVSATGNIPAPALVTQPLVEGPTVPIDVSIAESCSKATIEAEAEAEEAETPQTTTITATTNNGTLASTIGPTRAPPPFPEAADAMARARIPARLSGSDRLLSRSCEALLARMNNSTASSTASPLQSRLQQLTQLDSPNLSTPLKQANPPQSLTPMISGSAIDIRATEYPSRRVRQDEHEKCDVNDADGNAVVTATTATTVATTAAAATQINNNDNNNDNDNVPMTPSTAETPSKPILDVVANAVVAAQDDDDDFFTMLKKHAEKDIASEHSSSDESFSAVPNGPKRWALKFSYLLEDPEGVECFEDYLKSIVCVENLHFYREIQALRSPSATGETSTPSPSQQQQCLVLFNKYFAVSAPTPLNINAANRTKLQTQHASGVALTLEMFASARREVYRLMKQDSYRGFLKSQIYLDALAGKKKKGKSPNVARSKQVTSPSTATSNGNGVSGGGGGVNSVKKHSGLGRLFARKKEGGSGGRTEMSSPLSTLHDSDTENEQHPPQQQQQPTQQQQQQQPTQQQQQQQQSTLFGRLWRNKKAPTTPTTLRSGLISPSSPSPTPTTSTNNTNNTTTNNNIPMPTTTTTTTNEAIVVADTMTMTNPGSSAISVTSPLTITSTDPTLSPQSSIPAISVSVVDPSGSSSLLSGLLSPSLELKPGQCPDGHFVVIMPDMSIKYVPLTKLESQNVSDIFDYFNKSNEAQQQQRRQQQQRQQQQQPYLAPFVGYNQVMTSPLTAQSTIALGPVPSLTILLGNDVEQLPTLPSQSLRDCCKLAYGSRHINIAAAPPSVIHKQSGRVLLLDMARPATTFAGTQCHAAIVSLQLSVESNLDTSIV